MSVIIRDDGFHSEDWEHGFQPWENLTYSAWQTNSVIGIDLPNSVSGEQVSPYFSQTGLIRIDFPNSADGRGFSIARHLRLLGYNGKIRAHGHVLADQYTMARRSGFDEVEISDELAARQPENQWTFRSNWTAHDYQARLRSSA